MVTFQQLIKNTDTFFSLHWIESKIEPKVPIWCKPEKVPLKDVFPDQGKPGCYALIKDEEVVYIGSAVSKGSGIYKDFAIANRLWSYFRWDKQMSAVEGHRCYVPRKNIDYFNAVTTIGFPTELKYLALALEAFLIEQLKPIRNIKLKS